MGPVRKSSVVGVKGEDKSNKSIENVYMDDLYTEDLF